LAKKSTSFKEENQLFIKYGGNQTFQKVGSFRQIAEEDLLLDTNYPYVLASLEKHSGISDLKENITEVYRQVVNGFNYKVYFSGETSNYLGEVYVPFGSNSNDELETKISPLAKQSTSFLEGLMGGFKELNLNDIILNPPYQLEAAVEALKSCLVRNKFDSKNLKILQAFNQVVAGVNYKFVFNVESANLEAKIHVPNPSSNESLEIKVTGFDLKGNYVEFS